MRLLVFANISRRFCKVRPKRSRLRLKMTPKEECLGPNPPIMPGFPEPLTPLPREFPACHPSWRGGGGGLTFFSGITHFCKNNNWVEKKEISLKKMARKSKCTKGVWCYRSVVLAPEGMARFFTLDIKISPQPRRPCNWISNTKDLPSRPDYN